MIQALISISVLLKNAWVLERLVAFLMNVEGVVCRSLTVSSFDILDQLQIHRLVLGRKREKMPALPKLVSKSSRLYLALVYLAQFLVVHPGYVVDVDVLLFPSLSWQLVVEVGGTGQVKTLGDEVCGRSIFSVFIIAACGVSGHLLILFDSVDM